MPPQGPPPPSECCWGTPAGTAPHQYGGRRWLHILNLIDSKHSLLGSITKYNYGRPLRICCARHRHGGAAKGGCGPLVCCGPETAFYKTPACGNKPGEISRDDDASRQHSPKSCRQIWRTGSSSFLHSSIRAVKRIVGRKEAGRPADCSAIRCRRTCWPGKVVVYRHVVAMTVRINQK